MSIYGPRSELDLLAVQRDDEALDQLARRQVREPVGEDVLFLLSALTADVDAGLDDLLATPMRMPLRSAATGEIPSLADARRRRTARAVTAVVIVVGFASVSGVSAAVTGDPLTPYRNVISTVSGNNDKTPAPRSVDEEAVHQQVLSIDAAIDAGQLDRAKVGVQRLRATLDERSPGAQRAALAQLAALEAKLARAVAKDIKKAAATPQPSASSTDRPHGDGVVPPDNDKKPADKPKPKAGPETAEPQGTPRISSAATARPSRTATEESSAAEPAANGKDERKPTGD
jgi:hypothetical protein